MLYSLGALWRLTNIIKLDEYSELIVNFVDHFKSVSNHNVQDHYKRNAYT